MPRISETRESLSSTFARHGRTGGAAATRGTIIVGDSIATSAYAGYAIAAALGSYPAGRNALTAADTGLAGVAGDTSAQILARFDTDVIALAPVTVHILCGTNDTGQSVALAAFASNIRAMVAKCRAIGARVILGTVPPTNSVSPADRTARVIAYNAWLARYALSEGIPIADYYGVLVDVAAGGLAAANDSGDGVHPSPAGCGAMATALQSALTTPATAALLLPKDNVDPWNYVVNGLFVSDVSTGWTSGGTHTGVTTAYDDADTGIAGRWCSLTAAASGAAASYYQSRSASIGGTAYAVGNWCEVVGRVKSTALSSGQSWNARSKFVNVNTIFLGMGANKFTIPAGGVMAAGLVAPAATTANEAKFELTAGTGDIAVAQFGIYDLTAMGVTDSSGNLV